MDRDGTIIEDPGYLGDPAGVRLLPKAAAAIRLLNKSGAKVIVVSNQSGVARGFYTEDDVNKVNRRLQEELVARGAVIDGFYFCPHHPLEGKGSYLLDCQCRKPGPGLLLRAAGEHRIDLARSYMIGNEMCDIGAGANAGCKTILVRNGGEGQESVTQDEGNISPDYIVKDIYQAAQQATGINEETA